MKKVNVFCSLLTACIGFSCFGQESYSLTYEFIDYRADVSESVLIVKGDQSVFKILHNGKEGWTQNEDDTRGTYILNDELGTFTYSADSLTYVRTPYRKSKGGTAYVYKRGASNWELTGNSKKIKEYLCQEALVVLNGRKFSVWFTPEISINRGPLKLHGLPGLVVEVIELNGFCKINLVDLKKTDKDTIVMDSIIQFFKENPVLEYSKYEEIVKKILVRLKIRMAKHKAESIQRDGGTLEYSFAHGDYYFVKRVIDIPRGTIEDLGKIDL